LLLGCGDDKGVSYPGEITIRIVSEDGTPVSMAQVTGGFDWDQFDAATDQEGYVHLPGFSRQWDTYIRAANHYPVVIRPRPNAVIKLDRTPTELKLVGNSDVFPVKFVRDTLIHLDYNGDLVTFLYNESGMTEVARAGLARLRKQAILRGDTLWYTTHEDGVYSYDIADPANPRLLAHLAIEGYLGPIAVVDSFVIVGRFANGDGIEVYRHQVDGTIDLVGEWRGRLVGNLNSKGDILLVSSWDPATLTILSLDDPTHPREVFSWGNPYYSGGVPFGDSIVFRAAVALYEEHFFNLVLDISNPLVPVWKEPFASQTQLMGLLSDTLCLGEYWGQPALLAGDLDRVYWISALALSSYHLQWFSRVTATSLAAPPEPQELISLGAMEPSQMVGDYVVLDLRLWKVMHD